MDDGEFRAMIEEEVALLDRYGMSQAAANMRLCTSIFEAAELHRDIESALHLARIFKGAAK